jgi:hypothetical protein
MKTYFRILLVVLLSSQILSCKDEESPSSEFKILSASSSFEAINNCTQTSGPKGTVFNFDFKLQAAGASASVERIIFDVLWENGDSQTDIEKDNFTVMGNTLTFEQCGRFANSEWFELTVRVIDENNIKSNSIKLKVLRPDGAN